MNKRQLDQMLLSMLGSIELVDKWWVGQNKAFNGMWPLDVYRADPDRVISYIMSHMGEYL